NEQWWQTFGGSSGDVGKSVQQTSDGGYIIAGYTYSYGAGYADVYLIKTDANGNETWSQTFGGSESDRGNSVQQTADGGYVIAGYTSSYGAGGNDVYLIKTDENGNETWSQTIGGSDFEKAYSVQQTADGGYIIAGYTSSYGAGGYDAYLIKTDTSGNEQWSQTFGGSDNDFGYSVQQTSDGGYIITGRTESYGAGSYDVYLIRVDSETPTNTLSGALNGILTASYYHVVSDIWVEDPDSLFIEAGVTLLFDGDYSFEIHGNLYANGMEDDSIKFIPIPGVESWQGISFFASALYDDDELQYCFIAGANSSGISCDNSSPAIINCTINGNSADTDGGGISCNNGSNPAIVHCVINGNSAGGYGGGIHCGDSSSPAIENCTISGNHADDGGGISTYSSSPAILNTIVEGHIESDGIYFYDSPDASVTYCDFYNNEYGDFSGFVPPGLGTITSINYNGDPCDEFYNIFEDPLFVEEGDFRLLAGSPCVDAGDPNSPPDPDGTIADIGAFYLYNPLIRLVLAPLNPPIVIPETGGSFEFNITGENMAYLTVTVDFWTLVLLPGVGGLEIMNVSDIVIEPGEVISVDREQEVPALAPAGTYTYYGYVGDYPWVVDNQDSFTFEKEGTDGAGYLGTAADWICSGESFTGETAQSSHPSEFILHPCTPNPFNPTTAISYQLPAASYLKLTVYDISGREVARLVDGFKPAGVHEATFDGSELASGVYFARLTAGGMSQVRKLIMVK
ncbi:MAG: right-handed parallel beta-helix repeat-containing protein, partial [candidate division Zixibacteria bacterium]|nr:right-handed parallel beta-helix repeat-containing protein [Candidatus Tariuqbacter arcticus]